MSARRPVPHPAVPPWLAAALVVLVALLGVVGPAVAMPSPEPSPEPTSTGTQDGAAVEVEVTAVTPQVLRPADELVVRATLRNTGDSALDAPRARLRVNRVPQATRSSLEQWTSQGLDDTAGTPVLTVPLDGPLAAGEAADVELRVPAAALGLPTAAAAWGPRGISVEVADGTRREGIQRTFLLWWPVEQAVAPTRVSVLVPLTGGPVDPSAPDVETPTGAATDDATTDPTTDATTRAAPTAPAGEEPAPPSVPGAPTGETLRRLDDVLDVTRAQPGVSWAVDPALLAAARSRDAGNAANRWAQELTAAAAGRDVVTLPSRDPDLAALAHSGDDQLAVLATTTAGTVTDPGLGSPPRTGLAWPAADVPDLETVALAARLGATSVVVGDDGLVPEELTYTPSGRGTVPTPTGPLAAVVADEVLTEQLRAPTDPTPATAAQRVLAETAVITRERPTEQRHLLVAADRDWAPDAALAGAQLAALAAAVWVELAPVSTLVDAADPGVVREPLPERRVDDGELAPGSVRSLVRAHVELTAFSTVVPEPARLLRGADDAVLAPTSVAWRADPGRRSGVVDAVVADLTARRSGVSIVPGSSLNLISESGRFPLGLRNDLDQDATVQVAVDPASSLLVIDGPERITVPAQSEAQARIPFHAVGSGDVVVRVSLLTPEGVPLGPPERFTVRVRADWENVGTAVVAGLLGVALVVGIIRTIRRGQTARRGAGLTPVTQIAALPRREP